VVQYLSKTGTYNSHWCRWHNFTTKALLSITQHFYLFYSDMQLNKNTHKALMCFELQNGYANSPRYHFIL